MTEEIQQRIIADLDNVLNHLPDDPWTQNEFPKLAKMFKSLIAGKRKHMPTWQIMHVLHCISRQYGINTVWNDREHLCYLHVTDAPSCYDDGTHSCTLTYYGVYTASEIINNIYAAMHQVKVVFLYKYKNIPVFADTISRLKEVNIL